MKTTKALVLLALGLLCLALPGALAAASGKWVELNETQYGFRVLMPERPEEAMTRNNFHVGHVLNHIYTARGGGQTFRVDVSDLPHVAVSFVGADTILDNTRSGILKKEFGRQVSYENTALGDLPGKALVYETAATDSHPGARGEARIFLHGNRLYVAEALTPKGMLPGGADKFFASFRIQ